MKEQIKMEQELLERASSRSPDDLVCEFKTGMTQDEVMEMILKTQSIAKRSKDNALHKPLTVTVKEIKARPNAIQQGYIIANTPMDAPFAVLYDPISNFSCHVGSVQGCADKDGFNEVFSVKPEAAS
ncbi:hypothetical protein ACEQ2M_000580 [Vibrio parahaemolyticus]